MLSWLFPPEDTKPTSRKRALLLPGGRTVDVVWARHARARRLKLSITEKGPRLSLPLRVSERHAEAFLLEHREWLQSQLERVGVREAAAGLLPFQTTELPLHGVSRTLRWQTARWCKLEADDEGLIFHAPSMVTPARARATLQEFYVRHVQTAMAGHWAAHAPGFTRGPSVFRVRLLSSLWGSLSARDEVTLDLSLALARPSALEYVLVHELCHLLHRDHSPRFWREVERRFPEWQAERDYLHGEGLRLKAAARALLR